MGWTALTIARIRVDFSKSPMLTRIHIRDLAIVRSVELDLAPGMSALTGETGAGKSILIDALGLVLGDRADNTIIRAGCDSAEVSAVFDLSNNPEPLQWLKEQTLEDGNECILRRVLIRDGRSRAFVNGSLSNPFRNWPNISSIFTDNMLTSRCSGEAIKDAYWMPTGDTSPLRMKWRGCFENFARLKPT